MEPNNEFEFSVAQYFAVGVNFKNSDVGIRSDFSLNEDLQIQCMQMATKAGFNDFILLNTCNRTEMYGIGEPQIAKEIFCEAVNQPLEIFNQYQFVKQGQEAFNHIFSVAAGLDSQILGDYEVLGQFKNACKNAKRNNLMSAYFERLTNTCVQSSKEIKTHTDLSKGTVSVSFAAVEKLMNTFGNKAIEILVIGIGNFGTNVAKNIKNYLPNAQVTLANRTGSKAEKLANILGYKAIPYQQAITQSEKFQAILVCAAPNDFLFTTQNFNKGNINLMLDLCVPQSIEPSVASTLNIEVMTLDDISKLLDKTLEKRKFFLPLAEEIVSKNINEFNDWLKVYLNRDKILKLKNTLLNVMDQCPHLMDFDIAKRNKLINVAINQLVQDIKLKPTSAINMDEVVERFIKTNHSILVEIKH
ncbi:MAG: glutamyl-tRNA reductase [Bacteroidota bacterium]|jgi:glutamyl-tRNA reductase